jgi:hypothetical protein
MHPTKLANNGADHASELQVPTTQTFAVDACAAGRYVLQLGPGQANVTTQLRRKLCHVTAIDQNAKQRSTSTPVPRLPNNVAWFDEILLMDLIEHLGNAEDFLNELRRKMARRGSEVIITVGNVACCLSRFVRVLSPFNLRRVAIPAINSHRRFTLKSLQTLLEQTGYEMVEVHGVPAPFPLTMGNTRWSRALLKLNQLLLRISKPMFAHQFCVRARPSLSNVRHLPAQSVSKTVWRQHVLGRVA